MDDHQPLAYAADIPLTALRVVEFGDGVRCEGPLDWRYWWSVICTASWVGVSLLALSAFAWLFHRSPVPIEWWRMPGVVFCLAEYLLAGVVAAIWLAVLISRRNMRSAITIDRRGIVLVRVTSFRLKRLWAFCDVSGFEVIPRRSRFRRTALANIVMKTRRRTRQRLIFVSVPEAQAEHAVVRLNLTLAEHINAEP